MLEQNGKLEVSKKEDHNRYPFFHNSTTLVYIIKKPEGTAILHIHCDKEDSDYAQNYSLSVQLIGKELCQTDLGDKIKKFLDKQDIEVSAYEED